MRKTGCNIRILYPVEAPAKFELVVNLKAAKQIGVTIRPRFGETRKDFSLRAWRLDAITFFATKVWNMIC